MKLAMLLALGCGASLHAASNYREFVAPDTAQYDLKGPVRSVTETTSKIDEAGKRVPDHKTVRQFDLQGYLVSEVVTGLSSGAKTTTQRFYDADGNFVREEKVERAKPPTITSVEIDAAKHLLRWKAPGRSGTPVLVKEMTYDRYRREGSGQEFDERGRLVKSYGPVAQIAK